MSFFVWNMCGFNMSRKRRAVHRWTQAGKKLFGCVEEIRVRQDNHHNCMVASMPNWQSITNYGHPHLGRIWFCRSDKVVVRLFSLYFASFFSLKLKNFIRVILVSTP